MKEKIQDNRESIFVLFMATVFAILAILSAPIFMYLNGEKEMTIECGEAFIDPGAGIRFDLGDAKVAGNIDTKKPGDYALTYSFLLDREKRIVHVVDTTAPVIQLSGLTSISVEKGTAYEEYGYTAIDNADGDVTDKVRVESDLDTSVPGVYHISYYAEDSLGHISRQRRTVTVTEKGPMSMSMKEFDLNPFYSDVICKEVPFDEALFNETVIFGDSFVGYMKDYNMGIVDNLWTRGAIAADEVKTKTIMRGKEETGKTFYELMDIYHPKHLIILMGNHTTWLWSTEYFRLVFDDLIGDILNKYKDTEVLICSLPPYDEYDDYEYLWGRGFLRNQRINEVNTVFCDLCRKYGIGFINSEEVLKDPENGYCLAEYMGEDRFHLSVKGFTVMLDYIKTHMEFRKR